MHGCQQCYRRHEGQQHKRCLQGDTRINNLVVGKPYLTVHGQLSVVRGRDPNNTRCPRLPPELWLRQVWLNPEGAACTGSACALEQQDEWVPPQPASSIPKTFNLCAGHTAVCTHGPQPAQATCQRTSVHKAWGSLSS